MCRLCSVCFFATVFISALWAQDKQFKDDWTKGANSPGTTLIPKETSRKVVGGRTVISYRLFASGLPKGQHFTLWGWILGSEPQPAADAFINSEGLIVNRLGDAKQKEDPIDLRVFAGRGERKRFALTSDGWSLQAFAEVVPFPIEQTANGCRLSAEMSAPNYVGVIVRGSGFQPNEALNLDLASGPEGGKQGHCHGRRYLYCPDLPSNQGSKIRDVQDIDRNPEMQRSTPISLGRGQLQDSIAQQSANVSCIIPGERLA